MARNDAMTLLASDNLITVAAAAAVE